MKWCCRYRRWGAIHQSPYWVISKYLLSTSIILCNVYFILVAVRTTSYRTKAWDGCNGGRREYTGCDANCHVNYEVYSGPKSPPCVLLYARLLILYVLFHFILFHSIVLCCTIQYLCTMPVEHTPENTQTWNLGEATKTAQPYGQRWEVGTV